MLGRTGENAVADPRPPTRTVMTPVVGGEGHKKGCEHIAMATTKKLDVICQIPHSFWAVVTQLARRCTCWCWSPVWNDAKSQRRGCDVWWSCLVLSLFLFLFVFFVFVFVLGP